MPPTYRRSLQTVAVPHGDGLLVVPVDAGAADLERAKRLDGRAARLWGSLGERAEPGDLDVPLADAERFLEELAAAGLVHSDGPAPEAAPETNGRAAEREPALCDAATIESLARAVLAAGHTLRFRARGLSMRPRLPDATRIEAEARPFENLRVGDIALYRAGEYRLVAHRVVQRTASELRTRGDSAARLDVVTKDDLLGVVTAMLGDETRVPLDTAAQRAAGRVASVLYRARSALFRWCFVLPLKNVPLLRRALRGTFRFGSWLLRGIERRGARLRRKLDEGRAGLMDPDEIDAARRRLYEQRSVQDFTALDENVEAGLTLIEEILLSRHDLTSGKSLVLGCGPGRECVALAKRGFDVTGLDRAEGMLDRARALCEREGVEVRFVAGDVDRFDLGGERFDYVVVFSGLYNMLLPRGRRIAMLRAAGEHLVPGGRVLLTFLSDYVRPGAGPSARASTWTAIKPSHEPGDHWLINEAVHVFPHPSLVEAEAGEAGFDVTALYRDQRAYDKATRQVKGYAILTRP